MGRGFANRYRATREDSERGGTDLFKREYTLQEFDEIIGLYAAGYSKVKVDEKTGKAWSVVRRWVTVQ
jgi:hypothetical protein